MSQKGQTRPSQQGSPIRSRPLQLAREALPRTFVLFGALAEAGPALATAVMKPALTMTSRRRVPGRLRVLAGPVYAVSNRVSPIALRPQRRPRRSARREGGWHQAFRRPASMGSLGGGKECTRTNVRPGLCGQIGFNSTLQPRSRSAGQDRRDAFRICVHTSLRRHWLGRRSLRIVHRDDRSRGGGMPLSRDY